MSNIATNTPLTVLPRVISNRESGLAAAESNPNVCVAGEFASSNAADEYGVWDGSLLALAVATAANCALKVKPIARWC